VELEQELASIKAMREDLYCGLCGKSYGNRDGNGSLLIYPVNIREDEREDRGVEEQISIRPQGRRC
jgi:hypothetical protein